MAVVEDNTIIRDTEGNRVNLPRDSRGDNVVRDNRGQLSSDIRGNKITKDSRGNYTINYGDAGSEGGAGGGDKGGNSNPIGGDVASPEGVIMLSIAVIFDIIGLIPLIGDFSDAIAGILIGAWIVATKRTGVLKRFVIAFILEAIPIVSDITPFVSLLSGGKLPASWIGFVYGTLKNE
jgi:hypothetical protein